MSFAYKQISPSQISISPNEVNKTYKYDTLLDENIDLFVGENIPTSYIDPIQYEEYNLIRLKQFNQFDLNNDDRTQNDEYKRLIFSSIKHLFYEGFIKNNGLYNSTSSYEHYPQTSLYSGSFVTTFRDLENITGLSAYSIENGYNSFPLYDNIFLYDQFTYTTERGTLIYIISINKNIYGNGLKENSVIYHKDEIYIRDDGYGNLFDYGDLETYNEYKSDGIVRGILVGNIIYNMGLLIITNGEYICEFDIPPVAVNDTYTFNNQEIPPYLDIYANDYSDCDDISFNSTVLQSIPGFTFPTSFIDQDYLYLTPSQNLYTPGVYKIGYKIFNNNNIESNLGIVTLNITNNPLYIKLENEKICSGSLELLDFTVSIDGGIPIFSFSYDNITYEQLPSFDSYIITGSIFSNTSSIYVKDYEGTVVSESISWFYEYEYEFDLESGSVCTNTGSITLTSNDVLTYDINNVGVDYTSNTTYPIPVGNHEIYITTPEGCIISESILINQNPIVTYNLITSSITCYNGNDGSIEINSIIGGSSPYDITINSNNYSNITTESIEISNLSSGSYNLLITDSSNCVYSESINISSSLELSMSISNEYNNQCYTTLNISGSGGTPPYIYTIISPTNVYVSTNEIIPLAVDELEEMNVTCSIEDLNGCNNITYQFIPERIWEYSGSFCEQT